MTAASYPRTQKKPATEVTGLLAEVGVCTYRSSNYTYIPSQNCRLIMSRDRFECDLSFFNENHEVAESVSPASSVGDPYHRQRF